METRKTQQSKQGLEDQTQIGVDSHESNINTFVEIVWENLTTQVSTMKDALTKTST